MPLRTPREPAGFFRSLKDAWSLVVGLGITGKYFASPQLTVHYPRQIVPKKNLVGYRGHIELVPKPETFEPRCIICGACQRVCPSNCISIESEKIEKDGKPAKRLSLFHLDYTLCSLCGLCVQSCPVASLRHSENIYLAGATRELFHFDLIARLDRQIKAGVIVPPPPDKADKAGAKA